MSHFAFKYVDKNIIKYRQYPCFNCYNCIDNNSDQCLYEYISGEWKDHEFKAIPFPELRNQHDMEMDIAKVDDENEDNDHPDENPDV